MVITSHCLSRTLFALVLTASSPQTVRADQFAIQPKYEAAYNFHNGHALVKEKDKPWGLIDQTGRSKPDKLFLKSPLCIANFMDWPKEARGRLIITPNPNPTRRI